MEQQNELNIIDFSSGIRASDINFNFDVIKGWIERERLRTSGWGLVEGFDLSYDNHFNIKISKGILIDRNGKENLIPEHVIHCEQLVYEQIQETVLIDSEGKFSLKYKPYSPSSLGVITYNPPYETTVPDKKEFNIIDKETQYPISPLTIRDNAITVSADTWKNKLVDVSYIYCDDRIDAILIDDSNSYTREIGINSTSPSETKTDFTKTYLIGFAHWIIGKTITVEFIINDRTYRKVYVDGLNHLYLNGKLYTEPKFIYFTEPANPEENDIWYDVLNNTLCVWTKKNNVWGWIIMNDFTTSAVRSVKVWSEKEFPNDAQTFLFGDDELQYRYTPGTNALEIIIDQQVVMSDQFEEVVLESTKPYLSNGIGFKLKNPLDARTVVQCVVNHSVKNAPLREVFQRAAIFTNENYIVYSETNKDQIFETDLEYAINSSQLEVFKNGARLNKTTDFLEIKDDYGIPSHPADDGSTTRHFRVTAALKAGDIVTYKISRYVWSYDQLNTMVKEIENTANAAASKGQDLQDQINNLVKNFNDELKALKDSVDKNTDSISTLKNYRLKSDKIMIDDLDSSIRNNVFNNCQQYVFNAGDINNTLTDTKDSDYVELVYIANGQPKNLIKNTEYTITVSDKNLIIALSSDLISSNAMLVANVIRFGR